MECLEIDQLKVIKLAFEGKKSKKVSVGNIEIHNNTFYPRETLILIIRSILRCEFWCMLETESMRVRFDYDYYMTIGCLLPCADTIKKIEKMGLFVEKSALDFLFDEEEMKHLPAATLQ